MSHSMKSEPSLLEVDSSGAARVDGALTLATVAALYEQAAIAAKDGRPMSSLDLGGVSHVDSSGLAIVLEWQSQAKHDGRNLVVRNTPDNLLSLARLCEASEWLTMDGKDS